LIPDALICFYGVLLSVPALVENFNGFSPCDRWRDDFDVPVCEAFEKRVKVLVGFTFGFAIALA
jgi:hypothetical protein